MQRSRAVASHLRPAHLSQALAGTALAGKKVDAAEHVVAMTTPEQTTMEKPVANWLSLINQRLATYEGTLFEPRGSPQ